MVTEEVREKLSQLAREIGPSTGRGESEVLACLVKIALGKSPSPLNRLFSRSPALLVSFVYLANFLSIRDRLAYRDWALDSGAFTAHNAGRKIELADYLDTIVRLVDNPPVEVFALDVIGDWRATLKNTEKMWSAGVEAIPTFHFGTPWHVLEHLGATYPKIALGGAVGQSGKARLAWAKQCFARVWPKRVHGFGFGSQSLVATIPWESVDASTWDFGPVACRKWTRYGNIPGVPRPLCSLRSEVEHYLDLERRVRTRGTYGDVVKPFTYRFVLTGAQKTVLEALGR